MATGVDLSNFWLSPLSSPTPKTPCLVEVHGLYLLSKASYSQFCVEVCDFSLYHGNRIGLSKFLLTQALICCSQNPTLEPKITTLTQNWSYDSLNFYH